MEERNKAYFNFARRAEVVGVSVYNHAPGTILPDVSSEATVAAPMHAAEVIIRLLDGVRRPA